MNMAIAISDMGLSYLSNPLFEIGLIVLVRFVMIA